jgi:hypothetical protein
MTDRHKKKNRGAQPGNQNARKHGYYSKILDSEQQTNLPGMAAIHGLDNEVALLRTKIFSISKNDPDNYDLLLRALSLLNRMLNSGTHLSERDIRGLASFYRKYTSADLKGFISPN